MLISSQTLDSMGSAPNKSLTSFPSRAPRVFTFPGQSVAATAGIVAYQHANFSPVVALCPESPQFLQVLSITIHEAKTSMSNNVPLQVNQTVDMTQEVIPSFSSGPLSFMLGLIWGTKGNLAL